MGHFTPTVLYKTRFDDDEITVTLRRLKRDDLAALAPVILSHRDDKGEVTPEGQLKVLDLMTSLLPKYVENIKGLTIQGNEAQIKDIVDEVYFTELLTFISTELFNISKLAEDEIKNSDGPPAAPSKDVSS